MRSIVAVTNEMDDAESAVKELLDQIGAAGPLGKYSCGIVCCDVEMNHKTFIEMLQEKVPFEIVGCTSIATFDTQNGARILSAVIVVLTSDDARISIALTEPLTEDNTLDELSAAWKKARSSIEGPGKLLFLIPPFETKLPLDSYVDHLSELSGDIPVFGGLPSSNVADGDILVYARGSIHTDRAVLVLVDGNIRPVFSVQNVLSTFSEQKCTVTKAEKNVIYTVNGEPFTDYLRSFGLAVDELVEQGDLAVYVSTPLKVYMNKNDYNDGVPVVRTILSLNLEDGSGSLFGAISEHSDISIATMKRKDIQDSCRNGILEIKEKIKKNSTDGYTYSTLICISCGGRYMVMADDKDIEGDILVEDLPRDVTLSGFYAYGEICPTVIENGKALNRVHNESIVMCAF